MGSLILPPNGPIYLDASGFIYSVERIEPYRTLLDPLWRQAQAGQFVIVCSDLVVLETLVKPLRYGDTAVERLFRELFDADEVMLIPTTRQLWEEAARLRADEEVSLTARGRPTTRTGRHRGERPDCGFIAAGRSIWETFACSRSG
jgi:hypothetical protein